MRRDREEKSILNLYNRKEEKEMKFIVLSKDFKNAVNKAMTVIQKLSYGLSCIKITAEDNTVIISGNGIEEFADIEIYATVIESGCAYVRAEDIVKTYNIPGSVTVEYDQSGTFSVRNDKKCCEIAALDVTDEYLPTKPQFEIDGNPNFRLAEREMLFTMENLKYFLAKDNSTKALLGYYLDGKAGRITACDGKRICVRELKATKRDDMDIIIPATAYNVLKKLVNVKGEHELEIYIKSESGKEPGAICFKGRDYTYITRPLDARYINVSSILSEVTTYEFSMSSKELEAVATEYAKLAKGTQEPMSIAKCNNNLAASLILNDYHTADIFKSPLGFSGLPDKFMIRLNPKYIAETAKIFDGQDITIRIGNRLVQDGSCYSSGMWFENNDFTCMVLPVYGDAEAAESARKLMRKI